MREIDCRGLACPAPVISAKKALDVSGGEPFLLLLDNGAARENVIRYCNSRGCTVHEKPGDTDTSLVISCDKQSRSTEDADVRSMPPVILIASDCLGNGTDELGKLLMKNFIFTLLELKKLPEKIIFVNRGVLLTAGDSEVIEPLIGLVNAGVEILSCGVCLEYYGIKDKLAAGDVTNMYTIVDSMLSSGNAVRL